IVSRIAIAGASNIAKRIGVNPSQITRWQMADGVVKKASALLAVLDFDVPTGTVIFHGTETTDLAKELIKMLEHLRESKTSVAAEEI
ncbi:hypothetical protein I2492_19390, partial [Budviciaceae bacterium CWB-B4]